MHADHPQVMDDPQRRQALAFRLAWRRLRQSAAAGRVMSLPALLHLHHRLCHELAPGQAIDDRALRMLYLANQPFRR